MYIKTGHVDYITLKDTPEVRIELPEEIGAYWSCNFHLRLLTLSRQIQEFLSACRYELQLDFQRGPSDGSNKFIHLHVLGVSAFYIEISEKHSAKVALHDMVVSIKDENFSISNNTAIISIDGADIFTIQGVNLFRVLDNDLIRCERRDNEFFKLAWNRTWGFNVDLFRVSFPYMHNYADAVQNELLAVFKWLKLVHNSKKSPFTLDSPLPSDMLINVSIRRSKRVELFKVCAF